ncbi:MAG: hypothetical protein JO253_02885 [Alphaproteobacteria bacterium]|nr:hypothetical protein [Alphaproteobacteria bacterium]
MIQIFGNNAGSKLAAPITNSQTTLTVTAGDGAKFPSPAAGQYFTLTAVDQGSGLIIEIMWCTAVSGDTLTVQRAKEGTIAHAYAFGDPVANLWTAGSAANLAQNPSDKLGSVSAVQTYAGNPNGHVAGNAAVVGTSAPSLVWDTTDQIFWVCIGTGTTSTAIWLASTVSNGATYCGIATGTANAIVLTPAVPVTPGAGTALAFVVATTNTGATTINVSGTGAIAVRKPSPTGPIPLTGGELVAGNMVSVRNDGTYYQLTATELGTAALADASSNTGKVAAVVGAGSITPGHLAVFSDNQGSIQDGGLPGAAAAPTYLNATFNGQVLGSGIYAPDPSTAAGGAFTVKVPAVPSNGQVLGFKDNKLNWGTPNSFTLDGNGNTFSSPLGSATTLTCNQRGLEFYAEWDSANNTWELS